MKKDIDAIGKSADIFMINAEGVFLTKPIREVDWPDSEEDFRSVTLNKGPYKTLIEHIQDSKAYDVVTEYENFEGEKVLGYQGTNLHGNNMYGIIVEVEQSEVYASSRRLSYMIYEENGRFKSKLRGIQ